MPLSAYLLPAATASTVLTTLAALQLIAVPPSRSGVSLASFLRIQYLPLLLSGFAAAVSAGLATHLAVKSTRQGSSEESDDSSSDAKKASKKDATEKDDKDKSDEAESSGKRWLKKQEIWSESAEDWVDHTRKQDGEDEDDDDEEHKKYLFYVKHRFLPKQPNSEGYVVVQFKRSQHIVDCLRAIIKHAEDLFEDKASVDAKELFLAKEQIQTTLKTLTDELEARKEEENAEDDEAEKEKDTENEPETKASSSDDKTGASEEVVKKEEENVPVQAGTVNEEKDPAPEASSGSIHEEDDVDADESKASTKIPYTELKEKVEHIQILLDFITEHFASIQGKLDRIVPKGMISFKLLWCVIKPGMIVKMTHQASGEPYAMILRRCNYRTTMAGEQYFLSGFQLNWQGEKYVRVSASESISAFTGLRRMQSLDCSFLSESDRAFFLERGKKYTQYAGPHYMHFVGALITPGPKPCTWIKSRADGRCMVDMQGFRKMNPSLDDWDYLDYDDDDDDDYYSDNGYGQENAKARDVGLPAQLETLTEDQHFILTPPTVYGFSFVLKEWGQMLVDSFQEISFDENAYDHLELDADHKTLIRALVDASQNSDKLISDVVQGKGGGIIAVLHGNPGVGKTLTAEAVAEHLKRPLYTQGAGDLGVDAATLEHRLRDILEIARVWKAVVLIDEADIFLEARSHHEISRNAMVGVFLRTLEYQQGILFLTTNRVKSFDEAFLSRFSVAIKYSDLDAQRRKKVWSKFLVLAGVDLEGTSPTPVTDGITHTNGTGTPKALITKKDLNRFANESLNGRVIKQTVRTAQALAISSGEPLNAQHIDQILRINKRFQEDFESAAPDYAAAGEGWQSRSSLYR